MITEETVMAIFVEANPAPDVDELDLVQTGSAAYLATLEQRSSDMTQLDTDKTESTESKRSVMPWLVAAAAAVVLGVALILITQGSEEAPVVTQPTPTTIAEVARTTTTLGVAAADPGATIEAYVVAYNAGDIDGVMALFSEESVVTGHPFDVSSNGLTEIRGIQAQEIADAASEDAYTMSNVEVSGDTVTWDELWINSEGRGFCQFGHSAVVEEGIILSWTWPSAGLACP